jgi:hypothetical protein
MRRWRGCDLLERQDVEAYPPGKRPLARSLHIPHWVLRPIWGCAFNCRCVISIF